MTTIYQLSGRRLTASYAVIQCVFNMAYCCIMAFAAVFLLARGFSNAEVGLTLTVAGALTIITQPIVAAFADRTRRLTLRQIVAALLGVCLATSLLLMVAPTMVLPTAALYVVLFCAFGNQGSLVTSLAMEHISTGAELNFSLARGVGSFAFAVLALILGGLTERYGGGIVAPIGAAVSLVGLALVLTFPRPAQPTIAVADAPQALSFAAFARQHPRFMALIGSIALMYFSHVLINTYTIQIVRQVGGTSADMGVMAAIGGFLELPAMALFPTLMRRARSAGAILRLSSVFLVLKTLVTLLAPSVGWLYVAQSLQFFAFAMFVPASVYYVNEVIPGADKVKGQAGIMLGTNVSGILGSLLGGLMLDMSGGVGLMLTAGLIVSTIGLALVLAMIERPRVEPAA